MSAFGQTKPDERYKKGAIFPGPERARIKLGESAMRVRDPWGTDLIALGAVAIQYLYLRE
jgi:hypothetical protein